MIHHHQKKKKHLPKSHPAVTDSSHIKRPIDLLSVPLTPTRILVIREAGAFVFESGFKAVADILGEAGLVVAVA